MGLSGSGARGRTESVLCAVPPLPCSGAVKGSIKTIKALSDRPSCPEVAGSIVLGPGEAPRRGELGFDIVPAKMGVPTRKPGNLGTRVATGSYPPCDPHSIPTVRLGTLSSS